MKITLPAWHLPTLSARDRRAYIVIAAALAVLVLAYVLLPALDNWGATRDRIAAERAEFQVIADKVGHWKRVRDTLRPLYGPAIDAPLPTAEDVNIHFVKTLQDALQAGGFNVESIHPQGLRTLKEVDGVSLALYQVAGKCQAEQLPQCLAALSSAPRLIMVDRLSITSDEHNPGALSMSLTLATFARGGGTR